MILIVILSSLAPVRDPQGEYKKHAFCRAAADQIVPGRMSKNPITLIGLLDIGGEERWLSVVSRIC
jgi:hypothetical protein